MTDRNTLLGAWRALADAAHPFAALWHNHDMENLTHEDMIPVEISVGEVARLREALGLPLAYDELDFGEETNTGKEGL